MGSLGMMRRAERRRFDAGPTAGWPRGSDPGTALGSWPRVWALACLPAFVLGCGAVPSIQPEPSEPRWTQAFGGGFTRVCRSSETLWLGTSHQVMKFRLVSGRPPVYSEAHNLMVGGQAVEAVKSTCTTRDGGHHEVGQRVEKAPSWTPGLTVSSKSTEFRLKEDHLIRVSRKGWVYGRGKGNLDWRRVTGEIRDAVFDGRNVWMISDDGLWRVSTKTGRIVPIVLPDRIVAHKPKVIFRDGGLLWIQTESGMAWPLSIRGNYAYPSGSGGRLAPPPAETTFPMGRGVIHWQKAGTPIHFTDDVGRRVDLVKSVDSLLPITSNRLLLGTGNMLEYWGFELERPRRIARIHTGGRTVRLFTQGKRVIAVGRNYGLWLGNLGQVRRIDKPVDQLKR